MLPDSKIVWTNKKWLTLCESSRPADVIRKYLLNKEHKIWMAKANITVEHILVGKYELSHIGFVHEILDDWNQKLGWVEFIS